MGTVYTEIILKNAADVSDAQRGHRAENDVRQCAVRALVDTGAGTLVINEDVQRQLDLEIEGLRNAYLADGLRQVCRVTEPVRIHWKNRDTACRALLLPGAEEVLLGAIPLEDMDLIVDPAGQELSGAHGDDVVCLIK
ncbi:MAG: retroviral-like aspartic protease family protein [Treponema sp.]|nr:retroviral-like aspartic protease family protein [Treponema sp.]